MSKPDGALINAIHRIPFLKESGLSDFQIVEYLKQRNKFMANGEYDSLINKLDEKGQLAAMELMVNPETKEIAKRVFLGPNNLQSIEEVMNQINNRTLQE